MEVGDYEVLVMFVVWERRSDRKGYRGSLRRFSLSTEVDGIVV